MGSIFTIAGKELRVSLTTWTSYILFGAFVLISAFFFQQLVAEFQMQTMQLQQYQYREYLSRLNATDFIITPLLSNLTVFFIFLLPISTMRLFAEEKRAKTLQLLMTVPVRPVEIVLGKYLAALTLMLMMLGMTMLFPVILTFYGQTPGVSPIDWQTVLSGYLGLALMGAACVGIGLFASSVTESQIVAVIISFAALLMLYVIGMAARGQEGYWESILIYLSMTHHLESFVRGTLRSVDLVYYASVIFLSLFLTWRVVEAERWR